MHSSSSMTSNSSNLFTNTSSTLSNGTNRKRKTDAIDLDEKSQHKIFLTEEKLIQNMQTLALDVYVHNTPSNVQSSEDDKVKKVNENETNINSSQEETRYELHKFVKDNLTNDNLQDRFINKLWDLERKKFSMQIVPYMPIHPAQLNNNNNVRAEENEEKHENEISSPVKIDEIKKENDDHQFKRPFSPTPYTVEEPCENTSKRTLRMKRSYSQSLKNNSNLSVVELKNDTNDCSTDHSQSNYFILEPSTPVLAESSTNHFYSSVPSDKSSVHITEYFDFSKPFADDNIDVQSNFVFEASDDMDDDDDI